MDVKAIAISSLKGGVGKSTLALALARQYAARGNRVLLVDADVDQADAYAISTGDLDPESGVVVVAPDGFDAVWILDMDELEALSLRKYGRVILDGRPSGPVGNALAGFADLVLIPYTPRGRSRHNAERFAAQAAKHAPALLIENMADEGTDGDAIPWISAVESGDLDAMPSSLVEVVERELRKVAKNG